MERKDSHAHTVTLSGREHTCTCTANGLQQMACLLPWGGIQNKEEFFKGRQAEAAGCNNKARMGTGKVYHGSTQRELGCHMHGAGSVRWAVFFMPLQQPCCWHRLRWFGQGVRKQVFSFMFLLMPETDRGRNGSLCSQHS